MSAPVHRQTLTFLTAVRNRLWLEAVVDLGARGAWIAAAIAWSGGALHLAAWPRSAAGALALVAFAGCVSFAALARRPPAVQAAARADAWFEGKALMTSAYDQLRRAPSDRARSAEFVLARADAMAIPWRARLRERSLRLARLYPPLALTAAGLFLYLLPGVAPRPFVEPLALSPAGGSDAAVQTRDTASDLLAWHVETTAGESARSAAPTGGSQSQPVDDPAVSAPNEASAAAAAGPRHGAAAATALDATTTRPGVSQPRDGEPHAPGRDEELPVTYVEIPRAGDAAATGEAGVEIEPRNIAAHGGTAVGGSADPARMVEIPSRSHLSPTERTYAARFLRATGTIP